MKDIYIILTMAVPVMLLGAFHIYIGAKANYLPPFTDIVQPYKHLKHGYDDEGNRFVRGYCIILGAALVVVPMAILVAVLLGAPIEKGTGIYP